LRDALELSLADSLPAPVSEVLAKRAPFRSAMSDILLLFSPWFFTISESIMTFVLYSGIRFLTPSNNVVLPLFPLAP
jgi:hypothetical protein